MKKYLVKFLALIIGLLLFSLIPKEEWGIWDFIFYGICIILASVIGHCIYKKHYWRAVLFAIFISSVILTIGLIIENIIHLYHAFGIEIATRNLPDMIMWSGVISMYNFLYTFPVSFPVSMIIGDIFNWYRRKIITIKP